MAGILEAFADPANQGVLSLASNLLRAGGPSYMPTSFGSGLGTALQGFQQDRMQQQKMGLLMEQAAAQRQMQSIAFQQHQQALADAQAKQARLEAYASQLPPGKREQFLADPAAFLKGIATPHAVGNSLVGMTPEGGATPLYTAPEKPTLQEIPVPGKPGVTQKIWLKPGETQGPVVGGEKAPEILNPDVLKAKIQVAQAGKPDINTRVALMQESEEKKTVGKFFGDNYAKIQEAGFNAPANVNRIDRLNQLLQGVETGKLTPAGTEVAALADSLGFKIDKNLGNKQAAVALSNEIALQLRNPSGGAGMPGAMSDQDRVFLQSMVPGLAMTAEGRKQVTQTVKKIAQRDQQVAQMARDYRKKNGQIDEGFYQELQDFSNKNPLFASKGAVDVRSQADAILKGQ